jgi:hypothetical protein
MKNIVRFSPFVNADLNGNLILQKRRGQRLPFPTEALARLPAPRLPVPSKERQMSELFGLVILMELSRKDGRRKHEFEHLRETRPFRARLHRFMQALRILK